MRPGLALRMYDLPGRMPTLRMIWKAGMVEKATKVPERIFARLVLGASVHEVVSGENQLMPLLIDQ